MAATVATPTEPELPPGVYGFGLSLDGYQTADRKVTISPQKPQAVEVTLQRGNGPTREPCEPVFLRISRPLCRRLVARARQSGLAAPFNLPGQ